MRHIPTAPALPGPPGHHEMEASLGQVLGVVGQPGAHAGQGQFHNTARASACQVPEPGQVKMSNQASMTNSVAVYPGAGNEDQGNRRGVAVSFPGFRPTD